MLVTEISATNRNFGRKSKFWSKIEILLENGNFGQKSKFWSKIESSVKNRKFGQKNVAENITCNLTSNISYFDVFGPPRREELNFLLAAGSNL